MIIIYIIIQSLLFSTLCVKISTKLKNTQDQLYTDFSNFQNKLENYPKSINFN